jgi:hypothetical protein
MFQVCLPIICSDSKSDRVAFLISILLIKKIDGRVIKFRIKNSIIKICSNFYFYFVIKQIDLYMSVYCFSISTFDFILKEPETGLFILLYRQPNL